MGPRSERELILTVVLAATTTEMIAPVAMKTRKIRLDLIPQGASAMLSVARKSFVLLVVDLAGGWRTAVQCAHPVWTLCSSSFCVLPSCSPSF